MRWLLFFNLFLFACNSSYQKKTFFNAKETYIVKTIKNFDTSHFNEVGAFYDGTEPTTNLLIEGQYYTVSRLNDMEEKEFIKNLESLEGVYYASPNRKVLFPKIISSGRSNLKSFGLDQGNLDEDMEASHYEYALQITHARDWIDLYGNVQKGAYTDVGYGDNTVVIAIIDTGLNMKHPDFIREGKSICLYAKSMYSKDIDFGSGDFIELDIFRDVPIGENEDGGGHGTHCSGTMCAVEGNNEGIAGVAYKNTYIISYKGLGLYAGSDKGIYGALGDLVEITSILKKEPSSRTPEEKAKIPSSVPQDFQITQKTIPVNMSLGSTSLNMYEVEMINLAIAHDVLPVVAMGNEGRVQLGYPRSIHGCISVGATTNQDKRAFFSDAGESMSVSAPGFDIISTYNGDWSSYKVLYGSDKSGTQFMSGTSMATPFVTGTIGYLLSFNGGHRLDPYQIKKILEDTADKIDEGNAPFGTYINGHSIYYGYGRINVLEAARCIEKKVGAKPIPEENSFYLANPLTITTFTDRVKVRLYEVLDDNSLFLQGIAITDKTKKTYFYGLKEGGKYKVTSYVGSILKEYEFTASKADIMEHTFN